MRSILSRVTALTVAMGFVFTAPVFAEKLTGVKNDYSIWRKLDFSHFSLWCRQNGTCSFVIKGKGREVCLGVPGHFDFGEDGKPRILSWAELDGDVKRLGDKTIVEIAGVTNNELKIVKWIEVMGNTMTAEMSIRMIGIAPKIDCARAWNPVLTTRETMPFVAETDTEERIDGDLKAPFATMRKVKRLRVALDDERLAMTITPLDGAMLTVTSNAGKPGAIAYWDFFCKTWDKWTPGKTEKIRWALSVDPIPEKHNADTGNTWTGIFK